MSAGTTDPVSDTQSPIDSFSQCHAGIVSCLQAFAELPDLTVAAERARQVAANTLTMFDRSVLRHHQDEEAELFPAVLRSAAPGEEHARVADTLNYELSTGINSSPTRARRVVIDA